VGAAPVKADQIGAEKVGTKDHFIRYGAVWQKKRGSNSNSRKEGIKVDETRGKMGYYLHRCHNGCLG